ncbi:23S rRNA (adenine(1618)-N(6))-methyltransferase RlmF [Shewanella sp. 1CM18E]|uniref:23S rRNA (adenine(1618)-N(6))-methyltransferase RlmF n=1 Tax=Shewanella sp. 1CM18E TaxID=2929169 RepID=UPI0020BF4FB3|nr:23S rRNA (adenine(1618)-N(6))-methyltransferase RlmF [Shewanella sp. 1CM18E]MCK8045054.1 23S rRNA (adenine(1618)-N(6))-methyltransferase RlmF [Shewanella sp. 1CM18E]
MTYKSKPAANKPNKTSAPKRAINSQSKKTANNKSVKVQPSKSLHPRNLHNNGYDFPALVASLSALKPFVKPNPFGNLSIDFANPQAVKLLNSALLKLHYGVEHWDIPQGFLCPPIPGRADYIHYIADLLAVKKTNKKRVPKGPRVKALDIGTGANAIYPLLGIQSYGWDFVASDVDPLSIANAERIFAANPAITDKFTARLQANPKQVFAGIIKDNDRFDITLCNPPFHASLAEASAGTSRKLQNLAANKAAKGTVKSNAKIDTKAADTVLNFGGQKAELWCDGGEQAFLSIMINESQQFAAQCLWFTTLVSKKDNLKPAKALLSKVKALEVQEIEMHQGNKTTRILAWTFMSGEQRELWLQYRDANC